jgi:hypothetical protein
MSEFYKRAAESDLGQGVAYIEVTDGWPTRQVEVYGELWRWGDLGNRRWLADQPIAVLGLSADDAIQREEFELIWAEAKTRCLRPS